MIVEWGRRMIGWLNGLGYTEKIQLVTIIAVFTGVVVAIVQIAMTRKWNKQREAFRMINDLQNRIYDKDYIKTVTFLGLLGTGEKIDEGEKLSRIKNSNLLTGETRLLTLAILNDFESLSIAYIKKHIDRKVVRVYFGLILVDSYDAFSPYIDALNDGGAEKTHQNFHKVYQEFKKGSGWDIFRRAAT
jgi:hypothetical protein